MKKWQIKMYRNLALLLPDFSALSKRDKAKMNKLCNEMNDCTNNKQRVIVAEKMQEFLFPEL